MAGGKQAEPNQTRKQRNAYRQARVKGHNDNDTDRQADRQWAQVAECESEKQPAAHV